ncbi:MAG: DUF4215 domain-containing protein, partial [Polyangiales bacterium]
CDDGNASDNDACKNDCTAARCGDGLVELDVEACDDGNPDNSDACTTTCETARCGDGYVQAGSEPCDDGNLVNEDACLTGCVLARCGDGHMQEGVEACDDGNPDNSDGCLNGCALARCGDGYIRAELEACDDGNSANDDTCLASCQPARCGDGYVRDGVEACDDGNTRNNDGCVAECAAASCGDGYVQDGVEACDDGNAHDDDACDSRCEPRERVVAGSGSFCVLRSSGVVRCWGYNNWGQLGRGDTASRGDDPDELGQNLSPVDLGDDQRAIDLAGGAFFFCALLDGGAVKCWGQNSSGQLGLGDTRTRGSAPGQLGDALASVDLGTGRTAHALAAGDNSACAILDDRTLKCWGQNSAGQLGQGSLANIGDTPDELGDALPPVRLGDGRYARQVVAGTLHTCVLLDDASVKCWGGAGLGQLGLGDTFSRGGSPEDMGDALETVDFGAGRSARQLYARGNNTCARLDDGTLRCWGQNQRGQALIGNATTIGDAPGELGDALQPAAFGSNRRSRALGLGLNHACAILDDNTLKCWGYNGYGGLGYGDTLKRGDTPSTIGDLLPVVDLGRGVSAQSVAVTWYTTCALTTDQRIKCWGFNGAGETAHGNTTTVGSAANQMGDALVFSNVP